MLERTRIPADTGYAWIVVLASFVMQGCAIGVISGFGVFLEHYTNHVFPTHNKSQVAIIVNIAPVILGMFSVVTGQLCQRFGVQVCVVAGAGVMMAGHVLASFGTHIWHFAVTQGAVVGVGAALIYVPANVAITEWFEKRRGLAAGLAAAGGGMGGVLFGQLNTRLLPQLGLEKTLRLNGVIVFGVLLISAVLVRRRETGSSDVKEGTCFDWSLVLNSQFGWFSAASFLGGCAYFIPLYFINNYAVAMGLSRLEGGYAGSAINIGSAVGRVSLGFLGDQIGYVRCYLLVIGLTTLTSILWRFSASFEMLLAFGILYGIPSGGYAGGFGPICGAVFGRRQLATMMGLINAWIGLGELIGPITCGHLLDATGDYALVIYFTSASYALAFVAMAITSHLLVRSPSTALQ